MNVFDALVLVIVLFGAVQGYRKGLISGLISLGGSLLGLVLAAKHYQTLLQWLDQQTPLREWLEGAIYKRVLPSVEARAEVIQEQTLEKFLSMFPQEFNNILRDGNLSDLQLYTDNALQSIALNFTQALADSALKLISFAIVYWLVTIVIEIIAAVLLAPLGFFSRTVNGGGGFIVGGLVAFLGLAIFMGLFSPFLTMFNPGENIGVLESSRIYPYLKQTFAYLGELIRFNFEQGLNLPLELEKMTIPIDLQNITLPNPYSKQL